MPSLLLLFFLDAKVTHFQGEYRYFTIHSSLSFPVRLKVMTAPLLLVTDQIHQNRSTKREKYHIDQKNQAYRSGIPIRLRDIIKAVKETFKIIPNSSSDTLSMKLQCKMPNPFGVFVAGQCIDRETDVLHKSVLPLLL